MRAQNLPIAILLLGALFGATIACAQVDDRFLAGYATAVIEREFGAKAQELTVRDGVVTVKVNLSESDREKLKATLSGLEGVRGVEVIEATSGGEAEGAAVAESEPPPTSPVGWVWLPAKAAFRPLIADPRWPHFSAAYHYYIDDQELGDVASTNFGETFPLVQFRSAAGSTWEAGLQAGVFAIFDMDAPSFDLVNADYLAALPLTYAWKNFSVMGRFFHQSSHLGDEYLLRNRVERINLSYEGLDLLLSYELPWNLRVYAGGGYLVRVDPSDLKRWSTQGGLEYVGPNLREDESVEIRPVAAVDVQNQEEGGWVTNLSPRTGIRLDRPGGTRRHFDLLIEYFQGDSPNGQFYGRYIRYIGLGAHLTF